MTRKRMRRLGFRKPAQDWVTFGDVREALGIEGARRMALGGLLLDIRGHARKDWASPYFGSDLVLLPKRNNWTWAEFIEAAKMILVEDALMATRPQGPQANRGRRSPSGFDEYAESPELKKWNSLPHRIWRAIKALRGIE